MNLSRPFVLRPIGTVLLTGGVALAGVAGFFAIASGVAAGDRPTGDLGQCQHSRREPRHDGE